MRALASEEYTTLTDQLNTVVTQTFPRLLVPPSTTAHLGALMELKSGVGGSESSLFVADLLRMYQRLANVSRWKAQIVSQNDLENGGIKDAVVEIKGDGAYDTLRWESGVHRVQRVPATEASGRVHTSTAAVLVLPLMEETDGQNDELFSMDEIRIEVMRARGAGGQVSTCSYLLFQFIHSVLACEPDRICCPTDPYSHWCYCLNARRTKPTSGTGSS